MSELEHRDKMLTLTGILLALFLGAMDQTIVATALPRIVEDLQALERYAWVATSYLLASTALVPIYGRLADIYSRKSIELVAVITFLVGSFLCGLSGEFGDLPLIGDGMNQLILFRAIQGFGGAGLFAMAFIIIADLFPPVDRGRYQGYVGAVFAIASVLGPVLGGFLTDHGDVIIPGIAGWRWIFYVNMPFGALALAFIWFKMPALHPPAEGERLDYLAAFLLIAGLSPLVLALSLDKQAYGWGSPLTLGLFAGALVLLALFTHRTARSKSPILDLSLFRNRVFSVSNLALFLFGGVFLVLIVFTPLFLINVVGMSATYAGFALIPLSLGVSTGSTLSGQLVSRFGHYRRLMLGGSAILIVGLGLLWHLPVDTSMTQASVYLVICGVGLGPSMPLYTLAIQNAVPLRAVGQATSASQFFRQIGGTVGTAIMGTVVAVSLAGALPASHQDAIQAPDATQQTRQIHPDNPAKPPPSPADQPEVRHAFATAIHHVYLLSLLIALAGWITTLFIPEIQLRSTHAPSPQSAIAH